jgi:hypothetical protein
MIVEVFQATWESASTETYVFHLPPGDAETIKLGAVPESSPIFQIVRAIGQTICLSTTPHRSRVTDEIFPEYVGAADEIGDSMKGVRGGVRGDNLVDGGDVEGDGPRGPRTIM